jgi:hypothetical protein
MAWSTLTHARLRAAQGDVQHARRIVERVLGHDPNDAEARALLDELCGRTDAPATLAGEPVVPAAPVSFDARVERERFRRALGAPPDGRRAIARLERWLARIEGAAEPGSVLLRRDSG